MRKALVKSHMAAGKNSKGKNLFKKRFPALKRVDSIKSVAVVNNTTISPTTGWISGSGTTTYTTNYVSVLGTNPITIKTYGTELAVGGTSTLEYTVTSVSGTPGTWNSVSLNPAAMTNISVSNGQYVAFKAVLTSGTYYDYEVRVYTSNDVLLGNIFTLSLSIL